LSELIGASAYAACHLSMESVYEYGSRVGLWRILREFERRGLPLTVFGVAMALQRHPEAVAAPLEAGHESASHGWRGIHHPQMDEAEERCHIALATEVIRSLTGVRWPLGWYTGRDSPNSKRLFADHGGYEYDSDYYGDDRPFWMPVIKSDDSTLQRLIVPYTLDNNDMRFAAPLGFNTGEHFLTYLKNAFDVLYAEGAERPQMMSIGLHCRPIGRPGRFRALQRFLDHRQAQERVWVCRRIDIARHWAARFPAPGAG
jgi:peptidoglycan/xylan/chitin deacetylase (PgdA/CDA1 family)